MKRTIFISALLVFICYISNDVIASEKNKVEGQLVTDPGIMAISTTVDYDPLHPPNSYQTRSNPYYWKNKKPHGGYWQQDVHYIIKARIDEKTNIISGEEWLTYSNNSPDTLDHVFFHLYQNAFQPGSYYDMLQRENGRKPTFGRYEGKGLGTEIIEMKIGEQSLRMELDNTILKVYLTEKLLPGLNVEFYIKFKSYFDNGSMRRRMTMFNVYDQSEEDSITKTHRYKHYNGVHWYPRISVYDSKFGWTTDQHLDKEFYGDFGTYDIELDFANNYILGATGFLLNRQEMLPTRLRAKLDIKNFADKPMRSMPNRIIEYDESVRKIWKYHAENVHDFAFTADPTYRMADAEWNEVNCIALAQEGVAAKWQNAAEYASKVIKVYSTDFGMYVYHKIIVADARSGMEYPMITLDGGSDPGYRGLFAHEIGHNWFFGIVGNNETYRAALDEGFTQFLTAWCVKKIDGEHIIRTPIENKYVAKFKKPTNVMDRRIFGGYMGDAMRGDDATLNTHSSAFNGALRHGGGYRHVYYKTATMLYNLEYVLGDELFRQAMSYYYNTWKIAHPYFNDFRDAIIHYTKADLNWFFDQWMETTKRIDYSVKSVKKGKEENEYVITFLRKERMQMPIDFRVTARDGKTYDYYIPNTWFKKETNATILPKWYGWDKLQPTYEAHVIIPGGIKDVMIDPSQRLADINLLDNSKKVPVTIEFDHQLYNSADRHHYEIKWRPDIWYNSFDGIKAGLHANGHYMNYRHIFSATVWYNTGVWQGKLEGKDFKSINIEENFNAISFNVDYKTPMNHISKHTELILNGRSLDGLNSFRAEVRKETDDKNTVYAVFKSMSRLYPSDTTYLLHPQDWGLGKYNNTLTIGLQHDYRYTKGRGKININLLSSALISDYDYSNINMTSINSLRLKKLQLRTRIFGQYGAGSNRAPESDLYFAGASPEEMMDNKYVRSAGFIPASIAGFDSTTNNFHHGGGLNMRGYAGYYVVQGTINEPTYLIYRGSTGFSVNAELEFNRYIPFNPRFLRRSFQMVTYLFGDAGIINFNAPEDPIALSDLRVDAGVGLALTIKRFWRLEMIDPLTLRFDMPFFLNRIPATDDNYLQFRWVIGVDRAF